MSFPTTTGRNSTAKNIFIMSRPPFHIVGVLPLVLGTVLADRLEGIFNLPVFLLSFFAVILIMLVTYYNGEYYDINEDRMSAETDKNTFSGGSQVIAQNILPGKYAKIGSYTALGIAAIIGLLLQFYYRTGTLTIALGAIGAFCGYFYSNPPLRLVSRGIGEIFIGFCYGWLPISVGYYLQTQNFNSLASWISIPVGLTIINVILINEFPDYRADKQYGKKNVTVRLGKEKAGVIYAVIAILSCLFFGLSIYFGAPLLCLYICIPFLLIIFFIIFSIFKKTYLDKKKLEILCGLTLVVNIGVTLSYIIGIAYGL
jgi:1,4-dihydroxy-2-naphthoate polyprenyltransferase